MFLRRCELETRHKIRINERCSARLFSNLRRSYRSLFPLRLVLKLFFVRGNDRTREHGTFRIFFSFFFSDSKHGRKFDRKVGAKIVRGLQARRWQIRLRGASSTWRSLEDRNIKVNVMRRFLNPPLPLVKLVNSIKRSVGEVWYTFQNTEFRENITSLYVTLNDGGSSIMIMSVRFDLKDRSKGSFRNCINVSLELSLFNKSKYNFTFLTGDNLLFSQ